MPGSSGAGLDAALVFDFAPRFMTICSPDIVFEFPKRAAQAEIGRVFFELPQHTGKIAAGPAGEVISRTRRNEGEGDGGIFAAHHVAGAGPQRCC